MKRPPQRQTSGRQRGRTNLPAFPVLDEETAPETDDQRKYGSRVRIEDRADLCRERLHQQAHRAKFRSECKEGKEPNASYSAWKAQKVASDRCVTCERLGWTCHSWLRDVQPPLPYGREVIRSTHGSDGERIVTQRSTSLQVPTRHMDGTHEDSKKGRDMMVSRPQMVHRRCARGHRRRQIIPQGQRVGASR